MTNGAAKESSMSAEDCSHGKDNLMTDVDSTGSESASPPGCKQDNIAIVLFHPNFLGNIGSVARAMKNFGFSDLRLVNPPSNYKDAEARMMAVGAFDLLKKCTVFGDVSSCVEEAALVYGTTSGRQRSQNLLTLQEAAAEAAKASHDNRIVFLFGDEKNGLGNDELARCHRLVHISTNPLFSALNLAQAVGTVAYELTRDNLFGTVMRNTPPKYTRRKLPTVKEENEFFGLVTNFLMHIDFFRRYNREVVLDDLRRLYQRMNPNKRELDLVRGSLHKLNALLLEKRERPPKE
jgi:TrmH family RNA methyltransferase